MTIRGAPARPWELTPAPGWAWEHTQTRPRLPEPRQSGPRVSDSRPPLSPRSRLRKAALADDGVTYEDRMRLSYFQRQIRRQAMAVHHAQLNAAEPLVDSNLGTACVRRQADLDKRRDKLVRDVGSSEPLALRKLMSYSTLNNWRISKASHVQAVLHAKPVVDNEPDRASKQYHDARQRRREKAKNPDAPLPPRPSTVRSSSSSRGTSFHSDLMSAWAAVDAPRPPRPPLRQSAPAPALAASRPRPRTPTTDDDDDADWAAMLRRASAARPPSPLPRAPRLRGWRVSGDLEPLQDEYVSF
ncbi:hypothetical protein M885DRAFT_505395 [Pelagophyceae sp. CCMP2097]|nr:hypothetical protein M885DRAFT_505395 [Pelagophyceae sp. CCMP2097]